MKNKRILMIAALLIALALPLFAVQATVDWQWEMNDPDVQYFRYQLDSESEDGWTVVPADVLSYSQSGLDGSRSYTLYLQQSYDGINWSASASAASEPAVPAEAEFTAEPAVTEETVEIPVVEEALPVEEEPVEVVEAVVPETEEPAEIAPVAPVAVAGIFRTGRAAVPPVESVLGGIVRVVTAAGIRAVTGAIEAGRAVMARTAAIAE